MSFTRILPLVGWVGCMRQAFESTRPGGGGAAAAGVGIISGAGDAGLATGDIE